jgi:hypothetical protein
MRKRWFKHLLLSVCFVLFISALQAQDTSSSSFIDKIISLPDKVFGKIDRKAASLEGKLNSKTEKYLARMQKQEEKLKRKLLRRGDTAAAMEIFGNIDETYNEMKNRAGQTKSKISNLTSYSPHADSLNNAFQFLQQNQLVTNNKELAGKLTQSLGNVQQLQSKLNQTENLRKYLQQRQRYLKEKMQQVGLVKEYKKFQKQVYYYQAQVKEYRDAFENPALFEKKLLGLVAKVPAFQNFFAQNSELASVFQLPGAGGSIAGGGGAVNTAFPTREMVQQNLMTRLGSSPDPAQAIQQGMQSGTSYMNSLKNKFIPSAGGGADIDMPDYKVNNQKTKSFWKRIELGSNLQTVRGNNFFPVTSDVGLSAAFKISDNISYGLGTATKIGWGQGWNNIAVTYQGLAFRSFFDWKIPSNGGLLGNFWATGGAEMNYRSQLRTIEVLKDYSVWQRSALIGMSKKYAIGKKWKGNAQLLYDVLWKQTPGATPVVFRLGYSLR